MLQHLDGQLAMLPCVFQVSHCEIDVGHDSVKIVYLAGLSFLPPQVFNLLYCNPHLFLRSVLFVVERLQDILNAVTVDV